MTPEQAVRVSELSDRGVPDYIASYLATKPVTLPVWIRMQDFWRGGDEQEQFAEPQMTRHNTTEMEDN